MDVHQETDPAALWRRAPVPFLFARRADAEAPDTVETLRDALGPRAVWLTRADIRARLQAAWFVQQETRNDILHDRLVEAGRHRAEIAPQDFGLPCGARRTGTVAQPEQSRPPHRRLC